MFKYVSKNKSVITALMYRIVWPYMVSALAFMFLFLMLAFVFCLMFALLFLHSLAELDILTIWMLELLKEQPWISFLWTWIRPLYLTKLHVCYGEVQILFYHAAPSAHLNLPRSISGQPGRSMISIQGGV